MSNGSKGDSATMPLGSRAPFSHRPSAPAGEVPVSVGRCVKVTEDKDRLSGSDLVTVLGGAAVAHLLPKLAKPGPALRIVPAEVPLPGLPAQAQRLSRIESIVPPAPSQEGRAPARATAPQLAVPVYRPSSPPMASQHAASQHAASPPMASQHAASQHVASRHVETQRPIVVAPANDASTRHGYAAPSRSTLPSERRSTTEGHARQSVAAPPAQSRRPASYSRPPSHAVAQPPSASPSRAVAQPRGESPSHGVAPRSASPSHAGPRSAPAAEATPIGGLSLSPPAAAPAPAVGAPAPADERAAQPTQESPAASPPQPEPERTAMPPAPPAAAPGRELFRRAAVEAHAIGPRVTDTEDPKQGAWGMLLLLLSLVAAIFVGTALLSVEVTVRAPGALRAPNGLRSVESVISGAVTQVLVRAGDEVAANQVVARLEETQLRATLTLRERELETLKRDTSAAAEADAALYNQTTNAVLQQRAALNRRSTIQYTQMRQRAAHLDNVRELRRHGVATGNDELSGEEQVQAAAESIAVLGSQLAELNMQLADRQREWKQRELDRQAALARATAAVDEAKSLLALAEIRSPAAGRVESLLVHPGAVVQPGEVLAQIVPSDAPRLIVAFLPSREMSFVSVGSEANVEVESLPVNEFGMARAKVSRISSDIAKPEEIEKAFGEPLPGSYVRVELTLLENGNEAKMAPHLRSGERVLVRLHRRQQRVLSMIFEFARKWLDS